MMTLRSCQLIAMKDISATKIGFTLWMLQQA